MQLPELINSFEKENQIELAIELIEIGLPIWDNYNSENRIEYTDSVVGMYHKIDKNLINKSIKLLKKINGRNNFLSDKINGAKIEPLHNEIREPVVAREDDDFEIPTEVELILYSTSNLIEYVMGKTHNSLNENLAYISINQSIDAITKSGILDFDEIRNILESKKA
ncbi:hypothetical protein [Flavivirga jejuensis]|uniref:Uncharacterized protein n=1 Tax=Flavivirga jejuensis TaxID=870487 RepID=A0ABT8WPL4_9FLAO|nr:hypothetical protein [Flavivirga jejuensis]MDO5975089.1 hypothetical protein [Flavivirga jejuensis]